VSNQLVPVRLTASGYVAGSGEVRTGLELTTTARSGAVRGVTCNTGTNAAGMKVQLLDGGAAGDIIFEILIDGAGNGVTRHVQFAPDDLPFKVNLYAEISTGGIIVVYLKH